MNIWRPFCLARAVPGMHRAGVATWAGRLAFALAALAAGGALAAVNTYRTNSVGTWTDGNWSAGIPTIADTAYIGNLPPGVPNAAVTADTVSATAGILWIGRDPTRQGKLYLTNGSSLVVNTLYYGYYGGTPVLDIPGGCSVVVSNTFAMGGTNSYTLTTNVNLSIVGSWQQGTHGNDAGTTTVTQIDGNRAYVNLLLGQDGAPSVGIYVLTNGASVTATLIRLGFTGRGILNLATGTAVSCSQLVICNGSSLTVKPNDYSISASSYVQLGVVGLNGGDGEGALIHDGGTSTWPYISAFFSGSGSIKKVAGAVVLTNGATVNLTHLYLRNDTSTSARVTGWGELNIGTTFRVAGRVIADGFGAERDLLITNAPAVTHLAITNLQPDGTWAGCYAVNGGRLRLPAANVGAGNSAVNWGEDAADTTPDLVNSVRMSFTNVTGGKLAVALLATDRSDANVANSASDKVVGVWDFDSSGGFDMGAGSCALQLRYDEALAASNGVNEADLRIWRYDLGQWQQLPGMPDLATDTIATAPLSALTLFAVASQNPAPLPAGTVIWVR